MPKFRKKPVIVEAHRWFENGDHPLDGEVDFAGELFEGKLVRYYREGYHNCRHCGNSMNAHGWIDTLEGGHIVCPGDWIIQGIKGEFYPCKHDIFVETYEEVSG